MKIGSIALNKRSAAGRLQAKIKHPDPESDGASGTGVGDRRFGGGRRRPSFRGEAPLMLLRDFMRESLPALS